ncbi:MAG: serine hydrolase [Planctomycetota bacterium JB042]
MPSLPLVLLIGAALLAAEEPADSPWSARLEEWIEAARVPGVQAAVLDDGEVVWSGAAGVARRARGEEPAVPLRDDVPFPAASFSKPVVACVVLALAEEERLDLDAPIRTLLPPERRRLLPDDERFDGVTARRILSHSAGLVGGGRPRLGLDPGERFSFSGAGHDLLQQAVEAVAGEGLEALASRIVFEPAGMTRSTFVAGTRLADPDGPVGHDRFGQELPFRDPPRAYASYSLRTTAADYGRFLAALLAGEIVSDASRRTLLTPVVPAQRAVAHLAGAPFDPVPLVEWGLAFGREETPTGAVWFLWGNHPGFRAWVAFDAARGDGVVWLSNSSDGLVLRRAFVGAVLPGPHPAHAWIESEAHDDPALALSRRLGISARDEGIDAAKALHAEWSADAALAPLLAPEERLVGETGQLLQLSGRTEAAIALLRWHAELAPDDPWAHENLARVLLFAGHADEAKPALRRCLELDPGHRFAFETLRRLDSR